MEPATITAAAVAFAGSCIAQKCADATLEAAWSQIKTAFKRWRGSDATDQSLEEARGLHVVDEGLLKEAEAIFGLSSALRRARMVAPVLQGARILWVDDHPENNTWERSLLKTFNAETTTVETTRSALACLESERFDIVLSDGRRENVPDEGLRALPSIEKASAEASVIFYVGALRSGRPAGAFGITNEPNELLHLILDALERKRV
ncbi:MAG: hypothetical protein HOP16_16620 [Acidobacteria bacterium]|nr:hypothetical protein [Acidobacteriota bacterium]